MVVCILWRGGGEAVINKHWADVQLRSASTCVYVCVCSLSRYGCRQDHRSGRYHTAVSSSHLLQPSDQQIPCSHGFFLKRDPRENMMYLLKILALSSETSSWTPPLFYKTPALVLPPNLWLEVFSCSSSTSITWRTRHILDSIPFPTLLKSYFKSHMQLIF